jgi:DNA-binding MarR family transcriptional regulator
MSAPAHLASAIDVWRHYRSVHLHLMSLLARELHRATGLSEPDYQILDALLDAPGHRARALELRWALQWEKSRLSHHVARMVARGLLDRRTCTEDGRGLDIVLSAAGQVAARRARRVREDSLRRIVFETLGPEHMVGLANATALLAARLDRTSRDDPDCLAAYDEAMGDTPHEEDSLNDRMPIDRPVHFLHEDQPESLDDPERADGQEAPESSASAPGLQLMTAGGEFACTSDGCAVTFTKG